MAIGQKIGKRLTATVPRVPARILNGMIVAGMVVLLHCRRAAAAHDPDRLAIREHDLSELTPPAITVTARDL
jgi:hypothetical protein